MLSMGQLSAAQEAAAERALRGYDAAGRPGGPYSAQQPPPGMEFGGYLKGCVGIVWMPAGANARPSEVHPSSCAAAAAAFTEASAPPPPPPPDSARDGASQPASALPPDARDGAGASPPPPPTMSVVAFTLKLAGDVSSFTPSVQAEIAHAIAAEASVQPSAVKVTVTSGSVIVDVSIQSPTASATSVYSKLASATNSPSSAAAMLASVTGVSCAVIDVMKPATITADKAEEVEEKQTKLAELNSRIEAIAAEEAPIKKAIAETVAAEKAAAEKAAADTAAADKVAADKAAADKAAADKAAAEKAAAE